MTAPSGVEAPATVRLAEVLAALSLATDAGNGFPLEKSLRNAVIAVRLGQRLGLQPRALSDVYYVALLRSIGCTAFAHETAALLGGDDVAFHAVYEQLDPGHPAAFLRDVAAGIGSWAPPATRARSVATFLTIGARKGREATAAACEVSVSLAHRLGLSAGVAAGLDQVYERYDGRGGPAGLRGEQVCLPARISHVADIAGIAHLDGGDGAACTAVARRRGGHFDPALADVFAASADEVLAGLDADDMLDAALGAEPAPRATFPRGDLARLTAAFGDFADVKSPWTLGHSRQVARLAGAAAPGEHDDTLVLAGHLHDLGRVAVPNGIWDRPAPLRAAEWERVRLHPYYTERILARTPALAALAPLAGAHHERLDGSGYHRGLGAPALTRPMRVLAAADAYAAMTADRPYRRALDPATAARDLRAEADAGRFDGEAVEAVLAAAGHPPARRRAYPCELTEREVDVLRLLARGLTNKQIAARLVVSPRTVQHHVAHIYPKIARRSRAGAALFAMEHGSPTRATAAPNRPSGRCGPRAGGRSVAPISNQQTVQDIYAAFGRGDIPAILDRLADDVRWDHLPDGGGAERHGVPWLVARTGRDDVAGFFEALGGLEIHELTPTAILADGDTVVVLLDEEATVRATGERFRDATAHVWTFGPDGRVVAFRHIADTVKHVEAYAARALA